jgi:hypothetical protein
MLTEALPEKDWTPWQRQVMRDWNKRWIRDSQELRIEEWKIRQSRTHDWVCLDDIADCCARRPGDIERDPVRRRQAYHDFQQSILQGEFDRGGRLKVMFLGALPPLPTPVKLRLDAVQFRKWIRPGSALSAELELCWVPVDLAVRWLKARNIDAPPWLVQAGPTPDHEGNTPPAKGLAVPYLRALEVRDALTNVHVAPEAENKPRNIPAHTQESDSAGADAPHVSLSPAREGSIHEAVAAVYDAAEQAGRKPPNIKELIPLVKTELNRNGLDATYARIEDCAGDAKHKARRRQPGRTLKSERKDKFSD